MASPTELIFVRHGHTAANSEGIDVPMSGITDVPLGPIGIKEAELIAAQLAKMGPFSSIYTSPLDRALATARSIARRCNLDVYVAEGLAEIDCGQADGLPLSQVQERFPDHWKRNLEQNDPDFRWPRGESYREFRERIVKSMREIVKIHPGERIVVVTHSGVISQVIGWIRGVSPACWEQFRPRTGSLTRILWASEPPTIRAFDELPSPASATSGSRSA